MHFHRQGCFSASHLPNLMLSLLIQNSEIHCGFQATSRAVLTYRRRGICLSLTDRWVPRWAGPSQVQDLLAEASFTIWTQSFWAAVGADKEGESHDRSQSLVQSPPKERLWMWKGKQDKSFTFPSLQFYILKDYKHKEKVVRIVQ